MLNGFVPHRQRLLISLSLVFLLSALALASESKAQTQSKTLLSSSTALYARLVRLSHSANAALNGKIVASVTAFPGGIGEEDFYTSSDGTTFTLAGAVHDADFTGGLCCGTLFELPRQVGSLPAGTLIWSGSVGQSSTTQFMQLKVFASQDGGASWTYLSTMAVTTKVGTTGGGLWEPQFTVATDGALVAIFSDETVSGHSQILRQMRSYDGVTWLDSTYMVASGTQADRPGMAVISVLPSGTYFMTYEMCGPAACAAYYRTSADGWDWGDSTNTGTRVVSTTGQYFEHTPTNAWAPSAVNANGTLLLTGQMLFESNGTASTGNGSTIFVNHSADGSGAWTTMTAPVAVPTAYDNYCPNYSSPLLPAADGQSVLEFASDYVGTTCVMYYGSGAITGGTAAATVAVAPAQGDVTGLPMNVAITVTGKNATPTGTVTLSTGSWSSAAAVLSSGAATISLPTGSLANSPSTLTVNYSGDANFAAAVGSASVTVSSSVLPGLKVTASAVTVKAGASSGNSSTITVSPLAGFTGTVNLAATISSSPANASVIPSLSFGSSSSVTLSGVSAATATLTVTTQSASTAALQGDLRMSPWLRVSFASLLGFVTFFGARRDTIRNGLCLMLLGCVSILSGCGGSGSAESNPVTTPGTSTGDYVVTVTASSGSTTASSTFNLTVN